MVARCNAACTLRAAAYVCMLIHDDNIRPPEFPKRPAVRRTYVLYVPASPKACKTGLTKDIYLPAPQFTGRPQDTAQELAVPSCDAPK